MYDFFSCFCLRLLEPEFFYMRFVFFIFSHFHLSFDSRRRRHRGLEGRGELFDGDSRRRARDRRFFRFRRRRFVSSLSISSSSPPKQHGHLHREPRVPILPRLDVPDLKPAPAQPRTRQERPSGEGGAGLLLEAQAQRAPPLGVEHERRARGGGRGDVAAAQRLGLRFG